MRGFFISNWKLKRCQGELVEPGMLYQTRLRQAQTDSKII